MEKWFVSMKKADFTQIAEKYHISPIIARLIRNRDILGDQNIDYYLNGTIADLHDGMLMKNMDCGKISYFPDHRAPDPKQGYFRRSEY